MAHTVQESPVARPGPLTLHGLSVEGVNQCVHCGLCLASCPTFSELGTEMDSPRGRIFLIKSLAEGRIALTDSVADHLSLCLDCRACETLCPAGVPYGGLIEAAKAEMEHRRPGSPVRRLFRWLNFGLLLGHPRLLGLAAAGLRLYQTSGLQFLVRSCGSSRGPCGRGSRCSRRCPRERSAHRCRGSSSPRVRGAPAWHCSPDASRRSSSAPITVRPRACSRRTAATSSCPRARDAAARSTPTAEITRAPSPWPAGRSTPSRPLGRRP